jgi:glycyl-tRNA synthetase beta chain
LRTLIESTQRNGAYGSLALTELFGLAYDGLTAPEAPTLKLDLSKDDTVKKLRDFTTDRLRGLIATQTSNAVADATTAGGDLDRPAHAMARAKALHKAVADGRAWLEKAKTVAKRLSGISKESKPVLHDKSEFEKPDDQAIIDVIVKVDSLTKQLDTEAQVSAALAGAEDLAARLDDIFNRTLVNDPADARTPKRLELLSYGAQCMLRIGDFSRLV